MKKILKNTLIAIMCVCILIVLAGCGKKVEKTNSDESKKTQTNTSKIETIITDEETKVEFSMGEWKVNTYENSFLGVKFELPNGWERLDNEQIAEMMNLGNTIVSNDLNADIEEIKDLNSACYMVANDTSTGNNITIMSEKPILNVTTGKYLESLKSGLEQMTTIKYVIGETSKETVAGKTYDTLTATATVNGVSLVQKYYVRKVDNYVLAIIATSITGEDGINSMMKSFK